MFDQFGNSTRKKSTKWCIQKRSITATLECGKSHIAGTVPERKMKIQYAYFSDSPDFRLMRSRFKKGNRIRTCFFPLIYIYILIISQISCEYTNKRSSIHSASITFRFSKSHFRTVKPSHTGFEKGAAVENRGQEPYLIIITGKPVTQGGLT
jgi:hypothetical protein